MAENLKQKLNNIKELKWTILSAIVFLQTCCYAFATEKTENLSDEIFNAALQVEAADKYNGITTEAAKAVDTAVKGNAAEQAMAAEQVGEETISSGNHVIQSIKNLVHHSTDSLKDMGSSLDGSVGAATGNNAFLTKLIVVFILVAISIVIIVAIILIAKKFVFKKSNLTEFAADDDIEFDESKFEDDGFQQIEDDDDFEEIQDSKQQGNTSHTMIPPKSQIEQEPPVQQVQDEISQEYEEPAQVQQQTVQQQTQVPITPQHGNIAFKISEPQNIQEAMKIFLKITKE